MVSPERASGVFHSVLALKSWSGQEGAGPTAKYLTLLKY